MRDGSDADFDACMRMEMRAVTRIMALPDFYEGVRATILEKDGAPNWTPQADINAIFAPLTDAEGGELQF